MARGWFTSFYQPPASLATEPVDRTVLIEFYRSVRPFGFWKPIKYECGLESSELSARSESVWLAVINVMLGIVAISGVYLSPMYLVGHWYAKAAVWLGLAIAAMVGLRYTWYRYLPEPGPYR